MKTKSILLKAKKLFAVLAAVMVLMSCAVIPAQAAGMDALSDKMSSIKQALNLPSHIQYDRSLCFEGAGWAGPLRWEQYGGAQGIAENMEYVLTDMHQAIQYYITEPEPGVFYLLYGE